MNNDKLTPIQFKIVYEAMKKNGIPREKIVEILKESVQVGVWK